MTPKRTDDVRQELERALQWRFEQPLDPKMWEHLLAEGAVREVETGKHSVAWLVDKVLSVWKAAGRDAEIERALQRKGRRVAQTADAQGGGRAWARSHFLAHEAAKEDDVLRFRRKFLDDRLLQPSAVQHWIEQQAVRDGPPTRLLTVEVPDAISLRLERSDWSQRYVAAPPFQISADSSVVGLEHRMLAYILHAWVVAITTRSGGCLDTLRAIGQRLGVQYGMQPAHATNFVLTGHVPFVPPMRTEVQYHSDLNVRVTLDVDPTTPPNAVRDAYKAIQKGLLGRRTRQFSLKHLELAVFVTRRSGGESRSECMRAWNKEHPKWRYSSESNFRRDATAAQKHLSWPRDDFERLKGLPFGAWCDAILETKDLEEKKGAGSRSPKAQLRSRTRPRRSGRR